MISDDGYLATKLSCQIQNTASAFLCVHAHYLHHRYLALRRGHLSRALSGTVDR